MIRRAFSAILLVYLLGYALFAVLLPRPADERATDAIVVLTGGAKRIERGLDLMERRLAKRMLVSGVARTVRPEELAAQYRSDDALFRCCIDLGRESVDTRSNAEEVARWMERRLARRMLVSGVARTVRPEELAAQYQADEALFRCCIDLGRESVDTRSNAEEAERWLARHRYRSFRLITSDYHMRRARYDFREVLGHKYKIVPDAVRAQPHFTTLFAEYNKYVLRRLAVLFDI